MYVNAFKTSGVTIILQRHLSLSMYYNLDFVLFPILIFSNKGKNIS